MWLILCMKNLFCLVRAVQLLFIAHILFYRENYWNLKAVWHVLTVAAVILSGVGAGGTFWSSQSAAGSSGRWVCAAARRYPSSKYPHICFTIVWKVLQYMYEIYEVIDQSKKNNNHLISRFYWKITWILRCVVTFTKLRPLHNKPLPTEINENKYGILECIIFFYFDERLFTEKVAYRPQIKEMRPLAPDGSVKECRDKCGSGRWDICWVCSIRDIYCGASGLRFEPSTVHLDYRKSFKPCRRMFPRGEYDQLYPITSY